MGQLGNTHHLSESSTEFFLLSLVPQCAEEEQLKQLLSYHPRMSMEVSN